MEYVELMEVKTSGRGLWEGAGRACRCTKKEPSMKIVDMIRSTATQDVEAESVDYDAAREQLLASIPRGSSCSTSEGTLRSGFNSYGRGVEWGRPGR